MLLTTKIPLKYIFTSTWKDLCFVFCVAMLTVLAYKYYDIANIPPNITGLVGTSISLVIAFKLSQSYDRWWEARKIWGAIVNDSRTLVLQLRSFTMGEETGIVSQIAERQIGWCYSLGQTLRKLPPMAGLDSFLSTEELSQVEKHKNVPLALLDFHASDLTRLRKSETINDFQQIQLDKTIVRLCESMGKAERIKNTVFPTTYRLFLRWFIYIFVVLLSITLAETDGYGDIPLLLLITGPFFLLEKTAYFLQDPFENRPTDIPVTQIAKTIHWNIRQLLGSENLPETHQSGEFFVM
ncbi:MAG: bestrophin family ion channel [Reichenbachiella sp.]|uniref:bestrophin family protein n=1 Tax=Reichenbachiella sp. TaxID=2184521 RepID=UPI003298099C